MSFNLESTIQDFLSPNESSRRKADAAITNYFNSMQINDLSNFYSILKTSQNNNVKIYVSIFIKNFIEQKINVENRSQFIEYLNKYKYDILNIIINSSLENKTINLLILSLCKGLSFFQIDIQGYYKTIYELSSYILQFYVNQKSAENRDINSIIKSLFICSKFIKYIDKDIKNLKLENIYDIDKYENNNNDDNNNNVNKFELLNINFYNIIVEDYNNLYKTILNIDNSKNSGIINNDYYLYEYLILYLKIFKYSLNYLEINNREKILDINYNLIIFLFNHIMNYNNNFIISSNLVKYYTEIILLSNKIIIKYLSTHIFQLTLNTIKKYISFFYSFISNDNIFLSITNFLKIKDNNTSKQIKFIYDIIDFLYKLIELVYINFPEYKVVSKKNKNNNNIKEIIDYVNKDFLTKEKIKIILLFIIKKCLIFNDYEMNIAQESYENFYLCFTEFCSLYDDIKGKSGTLCNLLYTIFRKKYIDIFKELENNLISLTIKENELLKINQLLSGDELNIKCALLLFFYYLDDYFSLNNAQDIEILQNLFLTQIDIEIIKQKGKEIYSSFIIIRLLTKIVANNFGKNDFKRTITDKISNIFFCKEINEILIDLACFDLFNEYIDMQPILFSDKSNNNNENIFPDFFIQNYLIKISQMINKISSPELHSKIIETTNNIINVIHKDKLNLDFNIIIPSLELIWQNKFINNNNNIKGDNDNDNDNYGLLTKKNIDIKNKNKIYIVRRDLVKLINIIIKKLGFYTYNNLNKNTNNNFILFHNFIYKIMNYSFKYCQNEEAEYLYNEIYNLMILIQDNFSESISLLSYNDINNLKNICLTIDNDNNYVLFCKFFDFFNIILEQSSNINNNQYILPQLFIIEQFLSFCFIPKISNFIENENFIDKIIYILNNIINKSLNEYHQFIFNIMEYILYIINSFSNLNINNKNKYTDFIYQFIIKILKDIELNNNNFDIYFGSIQLANRLIFVNAYNNIISYEFNKQITNSIISLYKYYQTKKEEIKINFIQKNILENCLNNLIKIFNVNNNMSNNDIDIINMIKQIYNDIKKNNKHSTNYDSTSIHWLFFFNKITNDIHFYKLTYEEDKLRFNWTEKFQNNQKFISINKDFSIKYFFLKIDPMVNKE